MHHYYFTTKSTSRQSEISVNLSGLVKFRAFLEKKHLLSIKVQ